MEQYRTIFNGRLEFGNRRTYDRVLEMYEHRFENYYKTQIIFLAEELFDEDDLCLHLPRMINQATKKRWKNTINLFKHITEFAIAGSIDAWLLDGKILLEKHHLEPDGDKTVVKEYIKGRKLAAEETAMDEAIKALDRVIDKFAKHSMAYERRGYVNYQLKNYDDALYDYNKSIQLYERKPDPYYGRALTYLAQKNLEEALVDFELVTKYAMPIEPLHWYAKRQKANVHFKLKQYESALKDAAAYVNRKFRSDSPHIKHQISMKYFQGQILMELERFEEAIKLFDELEKEWTNIPQLEKIEIFANRGIAKKRAGKRGFKKDLIFAAENGSKKAKKILNPSSK